MITLVIDRRSWSRRNGSAVKSLLISQRFGSHHLAPVTVAHNCLQLNPRDLTLSPDFLRNLHICDACTYMHTHKYTWNKSIFTKRRKGCLDVHWGGL